uniref:hypothetical protein n=1 Tax=Nonomuraea lactucae TaxID=2249762 RepID=UPI001965B9FD
MTESDLSRLAAELVERFDREDSAQALDEALRLYDRLHARTAGGSVQRAVLAAHGAALLRRFRRFGGIADVHTAVGLHRRALDATPPGAEDRVERLTGLGEALAARADSTGDLDDRDAAIALFRQAGPGDAEALSQLGLSLAQQLMAGRTDIDPAEALMACSAALDLVPADDPALVRLVVRQSLATLVYAQVTADPSPVDARLADLRALLTGAAAEGRHRTQASLALMLLLGTRHALDQAAPRPHDQAAAHPHDPAAAPPHHPAAAPPHHPGTSYLDETIEVATRLFDMLPPDHPALAVVRLQRGALLVERFDRDGEPGDLDRAITELRSIVTGTSGDTAQRSSARTTLRRALGLRALRTSGVADLDELIADYSDALAADPRDEEAREGLDMARLMRFTVSGDPAFLPSGQEAADGQAGRLAAMAGGLRSGAGEAWTPAAISAAEHRLSSATTPDERDLAAAELAALLTLRAHSSGDIGDADRAIGLYAELLPHAEPGSAALGTTHAALLQLHLLRNTLSGRRADLDAAIGHGRQAVGSGRNGAPHLANSLSFLGIALHRKHGLTSDPADLESSIEAHRAAVAAAPPLSPARHIFGSGLSEALQTRFARYGDPADSREAVSLARQAIPAVPAGWPDRALFTARLAHARLGEFLLSGDTRAVDEAVDGFRQAEAGYPPDSSGLADALMGLADALKFRFERTGDLADLDESIRKARAAAAMPGSPGRGGAWAAASDALRMRAERTGRA